MKGYHHEAYAVRLDAESPLRHRFAWLKLREPRPGVLWPDQRCFRSEEALIVALHGHVRRIPEVVRVTDEVTVHSFIVGETLGTHRPGGTPIGSRHLQQIQQLFQELAAFDVGLLASHERLCRHGTPPQDGDSTGFLARLVEHTTGTVLEEHRARFGGLFADLGVPEKTLYEFAERVGRLTERPFHLLHGDLHRENFIVDENGDLWTIDWELARIGDPLYDLATHVHHMRYPLRQAREATARWQEAVGPDASAGTDADLPRYLAYKRLQSVYTDVIRGADSLGARPAAAALRRMAERLADVLEEAREPLGMPQPPALPAVRGALAAWCREYAGGDDEVGAAGPPS